MKMYFLTILTGLFILTACNGDDDNAPEPFVPQEIEAELVAKYDDLFCNNYEYCIPEQYSVFYNNTEWNSFISQLDEQPLSHFEETDIDFNTYMVIAAIDEVKQSPINLIDITSIIEYENNIVINVQKYGSGIWGVVKQTCHIVKIPKSEKPVEFVVAEP